MSLQDFAEEVREAVSGAFFAAVEPVESDASFVVEIGGKMFRVAVTDAES